MAKRFRLRFSRVIPSFHSCRSKDDAAPRPAASPVFLSAVDPRSLGAGSAPPPRQAHLDPVSPRRTPVVSSGCGCPAGGPDPPGYLWQREEKWHVVARVEPAAAPRVKIDSDDGGRGLFPPLPLRRRPRRPATEKKKKMRKPKSQAGARPSTSSADTHWFSSEEEQYVEEYDYGDTETLVSSSRSFSILESPEPAAPAAGAPRRQPRRRRTAHPSASPEPAPGGRRRSSAAAASSALRRFLRSAPCGAAALEGKVAESFAVVKRSEDPYGDFRRSMVEMVVEKGIYEERDLEQLLRGFLSLNAPRHHAAIVRAFSDVWSALFSPSHTCTTSASAAPSS